MYDPDEECARVNQKINELCQERGITRNTLAKRAGISSSALSYLLSGKSTPYLYTVLLICNGLRIPASELLSDGQMGGGRANEMRESIPEEIMEMRQEKAETLFQRDRLCERVRNLSDKKAGMLDQYMDILEQYPE